MSRMLSPFLRDEVLTSRFSTSAPRRLPARSNDARVRVLASKNRLATVVPRSASDRTAGAPSGLRNDSALSRSVDIMGRSRPCIVNRWRSRPCGSTCRSILSSRLGVSKSSVTDIAAALYADYRSFFSQRSAISVAAAESMAALLIRPRRPASRCAFSATSASTEE